MNINLITPIILGVITAVAAVNWIYFKILKIALDKKTGRCSRCQETSKKTDSCSRRTCRFFRGSGRHDDCCCFQPAIFS